MAVTLFARRLRWYLCALGFNPLVRGSDRLEALAVLAVFGTALFALPVATQAASSNYDTGVRAASEQSHSRHPVEAVALDGNSTMPSDLGSTAYVLAQWHQGTQMRTERVTTPEIIKAGAPITVWLNNTENVVAAPLTLEDARVSALGAGGTVWVVVVACSALAAFAFRKGLDCGRYRAWERELHLMANNDDGWANRHT